ncbi:hypothetical protein EYF80_048196 [Liparis tanakae]|uniref:Uncharacterized protein n=1 Tax=Liparis tanakae TaxID=230148 RepID=A0A4Z2FK83_9TELE|nr:hypothetical protein EYF80_048196 [Liparis tanakae]
MGQRWTCSLVKAPPPLLRPLPLAAACLGEVGRAAVHQRNLRSGLALRERNRISDSLELMPDPMTPLLARGKRAKMASVTQRRRERGRTDQRNAVGGGSTY